MSDYATRATNSSENYDFVHFKDYTFNSFTPAHVEFRFYSFILIGNCPDSIRIETTSTSPVSEPKTTVGNNGGIIKAGIFAFVAGTLLMMIF